MTILYIWSDMNKIFQLTSSRRGWLLSNHPHRFLEYFNSHPHEEDDSIRRLFGLYTNISTHILTKRMTFWGTHDICRYHISTHILTKRMTDLYDHLHHLLEFQLTSSRRGWPKQILLDGSAELISTHILTKRMTRFFIHIILRINISTHILTKRMTICLFFFRQYSEHISTHILTKRMTRYPSTQSESALYFNSHPHEEDDRQWGNITGNYGNFNSHPHEEDDGILSFLWKTSAGISTHILKKRMTTRLVTLCLSFRFQLTSSRRGWR